MKKYRVIRDTKNAYWNLHSHSNYSANDALPAVKDMVQTVSGYGQQALGLTDHGNMAGSVDLYRECSKAGIKPFPGTELYVVRDRQDKKAKRHHMCVVAYTNEGYKNLVRMNSMMNKNFYHKPLIDFGDFAELSENGMLNGIAATSGCYFGYASQAIASGDRQEAKALLQSYDKWFGKLYVELQNHNIIHDDEETTDSMIANRLASLAQELGLPCVLTQDAHYCNQEDKPTHEAMKRLVAFGSDGDDAVFPGDGFHLADKEWFEAHHEGKRRELGYEGLQDLLESHDLTIPQLDKYSYRIPFTVDDPLRTLRDVASEKSVSLSKAHKERIDSELSIIEDTGMAGYLLLVAEVTNWCRDNSVFYQARGSASGSMICWLLGITQVDPIEWDLSFERFISRDRTKPPDIDLDIEHVRRQDLIEWLDSRFSVNQIGTWMEYSLTGDGEETSGSLRIKYIASLRRQGKPIPKDWNDIAPDIHKSLHQIGEGHVYSSYGTHAAGLVVTTTKDEFDDLVPTMRVASSDTYVTQYDMNSVENLGLVKLDVLGLKTLSVLHICMENLGRDVFEGLDWIPLRDRKTFSTVSRGITDGVFQLEGKAARRGCKELKPKHVDDIVAAMALFRPATMQSGATQSFIDRKHGKEKIPERHAIIRQHTDKTYGIMLFQEQVIGMLRSLGMNPDDLTAFLKAVKASNADIGAAGDVIEGYHAQVVDLAKRQGMDDTDISWLWGAIEGFAAYGFNKAHSVAYGLTAYRCAYLATHFPTEFYAAVLSVAAGTPKEDPYVTAVRSAGIRIQRADVNESGVSYAVGSKGIRKGLLAIKGIGGKVAKELIDKRPDGGYSSLHELCMLVNRRIITGAKAYIENGELDVGVIGKLVEAGALDCFEEVER